MKPGLNSISIWFGMIMMLVVISAATALLIFPDALNDRLYGNKRIFFVSLLFAYAIYRGFRVYSLIKNNRREE